MMAEAQVLSQYLEATEPKMKFADRLQLNEFSPDSLAPAALSGSDPQPGVFAQMVKSQNSPVVSSQAVSSQSVSSQNSHLPSPMQEAGKMGGKLQIREARHLSAVLEKFQQSQQERWSSMITRMKNNQGALSPSLTRQLEMKMNTINQQFGRINKSLNLPLTSSGSNPFIESLDVSTQELSKPLHTFFNFIARGENQLYTVQRELDTIYKSSDALHPAALLRLQLKMTHISQQLELFTSMLNKGLESSKTVFNTQI